MSDHRKQKIVALLKGIETGDPESVKVVNEKKYIQHNPHTREGGMGLAQLFERLAKTNPRVNIVRMFSDGDFVFGHTEYNFSQSRVGFELFRFEGDQAVEHWDNIQSRMGPNRSGHSMVDGATERDDVERTESNRLRVREFLSDVLIKGHSGRLETWVDGRRFTEHNPYFSDDLSSLRSALSGNGEDAIRYRKIHRVLADGNFVMSVCEGTVSRKHMSFFDLFRLDDGMIVEHWDTRDTVPPRSEWKNDNGKF